MASESSSAVLDLNDADTEDTEATVTDDVREGTPLIMEHGYDIAVKVDAPMKQLSTLETFVTYRVRCVCARWTTPTHVRRRYNHFKLLHKRLSSRHPLLAPPPAPPLHSARQQLDRYSPAFVAVRTLALDAFLERIAKHPILTYSEDFRIFLTTPDEQLDKVFKSDSGALNLWGLGAFYGSSDNKTANGPRVKDPEFTSATEYLSSLEQKLTALCSLTTRLHKKSIRTKIVKDPEFTSATEYLSSLEQKLTTLCSLTTRLHKGTGALANEYKGMQRACDAWTSVSGGAVSRGAGGVARGAGGAGAACAGRAPLGVRARGPLLAAYARAISQKIAQRDHIHAAYVSGGNTTDEHHNRLSQASEALRSDLADWLPKTHADIKTLLLQLADRQVTLHTQVLYSWEHAHKLATEQNIDQIFKTVSKTAVQNLSPSRCRSQMTERDLDECSDYSDICGNDESFSKVDDHFSKVDDNFSKFDDCIENLEESFGKNVEIEAFSDKNHTTDYGKTAVVKDLENYQKVDVNGKMTDVKSNIDVEISSNNLEISNFDENVSKNEILDSSVNDVFNSLVDDLNTNHTDEDTNKLVDEIVTKDSNNLDISDGTTNEVKSTKTNAVVVNTDPLSSFCDIDLSL